MNGRGLGVPTVVRCTTTTVMAVWSPCSVPMAVADRRCSMSGRVGGYVTSALMLTNNLHDCEGKTRILKWLTKKSERNLGNEWEILVATAGEADLSWATIWENSGEAGRVTGLGGQSQSCARFSTICSNISEVDKGPPLEEGQDWRGLTRGMCVAVAVSGIRRMAEVAKEHQQRRQEAVLDGMAYHEELWPMMYLAKQMEMRS